MSQEKPENLENKPKHTVADLEKAREETSFWNQKILSSVGTPEYEEDIRKHSEALSRYLEISKYLHPHKPEAPINPPEGAKYTLEDLERERNWDSGFGPNNPNAVRRENLAHQRRLREIEESLKEQGLLEKTEKEKITEELDKLYPDAKSKTIIEYNGKKYQIRYFPLETSHSGKSVHGWGHSWKLVEEKDK